MNATVEATRVEIHNSLDIEGAELSWIETTLFDLIAALQDADDTGDDAIVIAAVADLMRRGRLRLRVPVDQTMTPLN